jgi:hypothetical protein
LTEAFDGNDKGAEEVFGNVRALSGVLDLFGENTATTMEILDGMSESLGITNEAFEITEQTVSQKFAVAMETFKGIMLEIGTAVLPLITDLLDDLAPVIADATAAVSDFIKTDLGPFIAGLESNEGFQAFLSTMKDLLFEIVPLVVGFAVEAATLAGNLTTLLKPVLEDYIGEDGMFTAVASILEDINFFFGELNSNKLPGFDDKILELIDTLQFFIGPLKATEILLFGIANAFDKIRDAYEKAKRAGALSNLPGQGAGSRERRVQGTNVAGGSVMGGNSYLVGERGPEIFMPNNAGQIIPNHRIGGGGGNIYVTVNAGVGTNGTEVGREIVAQIKRYERSSGKVFASA